MTTTQLVTDLRERGISLSLKGDRLSFESTSPVDRETLEGLKENKAALVAYLSHPLLYQLREEGVGFHAREGKLQPKAQEHAAYAEVLERETKCYLSWARVLLNLYPHVWLESPHPLWIGWEIKSQFKNVGKLAERRIWLETHDLWGIVTHDNAVLETWGERPVTSNDSQEAP